LTTDIPRSSPSQPVFDGSFAAGPSLVPQNARVIEKPDVKRRWISPGNRIDLMRRSVQSYDN